MNQKQKDLLCRMLTTKTKDLQTQIDGQFPSCVSRWQIANLETNNPKTFKSMSDTDRATFNTLKEQSGELDKARKKLDAQWDRLHKKIGTQVEKGWATKRKATIKLTQATEEAIISIQFAENADDAKKILEGMPTIDQLIA